MIVVRLHDGSLWVNSPIEISRDEARQLTELGPVRHLIAPTRMHAWRLERWAAFFPNAKLWTPANLGDEPPAEWRNDLDQVVFRGNALLDEIEFFHASSRTLVFADFIQQYSKDAGRPLRNAFLRLSGVLETPGVPLDIRLSFAFGKTAARRCLQRLLSWDADNLVLAHGTLVEHGASAVVAHAFRWLSHG